MMNKLRIRRENRGRREKSGAIFLRAVALLLVMSLVSAGCAPGWLDRVTAAIDQFLPAAGSLYLLVYTLKNGEVDAEDVARVKTVTDEVSGDVQHLRVLAQEFSKAAAADKPGKLAEINALIGVIYGDLQNLLPALHIKNPVTQARISAAIGLMLQFVAQVVHGVPGAQIPVPAHPLAAQAVSISVAASGVPEFGNTNLRNAKEFKRAWNKLMASPSGDAAVDRASAIAILK